MKNREEATQLIELELMLRVQEGNSEALGQLYDRLATGMTSLARQLLGSQASAEDLVQDVFMESWRRAGDYDPGRSSVKTWFYLRLRSRALDRMRGSARAKNLEQTINRHLPWINDETELSTEDWLWLHSQIVQLKPEQFAVIDAVYFKGLSSLEASERLNIPVGTVKSRLAAAIKILRRSSRTTP